MNSETAIEWSVETNPNGCFEIFAGDTHICETYRNDEEGRATAHVLSAAQEMLNALILALPYVETAELDDAYKPGAVAKITKVIRAAISKAEPDTIFS